ncbi:MAG: hypothetical protein H6737_03510 [Alphaproteobacteria bacterium]|nr:hypothetical protein [Alphaproteobacteria bacterium]
MTDPLTLATASVAAAVSFAIGWLSWPRSPALDGERMFKTVLAELLLGRVTAEGGDQDAWIRAVVANVPYHPAGRFPEKKVTGTGLSDLPASIEGEKALIERLAKLPDLEARWRLLYEEDEAGLAARLDDPIELGPDYDPSSRLGTAATWQALEAWGAGEKAPADGPAADLFPETLKRRVGAVWILVEGREPEPVLDALAGMVRKAYRVPWADLATDALEDVAGEAMEDPAARFVLVGAEAGIQAVLRLMVDRAPLRDRTLAVVSIGGILHGDPEADGPLGAVALDAWMAKHFTHHELDTEVTRNTPYFCMQWLDRTADPPGARGLPVQRARFPEPLSEALTQDYVEVVDLGVLFEGTDPQLVARGLWATVAFWVAG